MKGASTHYLVKGMRHFDLGNDKIICKQEKLPPNTSFNNNNDDDGDNNNNVNHNHDIPSEKD